MRKSLAFILFGAFAASAALADYVVVLKDGRRLTAKQKWTMVDGKAIVELTNGTRLQIEPSSIDVAASEAATRSGLGDVTVLETVPQAGPRKAPEGQPSLGSIATIRRAQDDAPGSRTTGTQQQRAAAAAAERVDSTVASKFKAAFENVGLFDAQLSAAAPNRVRIDVTADNENQVFNAISATAFIFANIQSSYDTVELFMKTTNGGSAGRFQMSLDDARALADKKLDRYDYYVRKVIF